MSRRRSTAVAAAVSLAAAAAGCGFGPGESTSGEVTLTVTRDYGANVLLETSEEDPAESETVIRFLDRETEITTRYGGGFVQSIDGISGTVADGRSTDWFFFVNGIESPRGAADVPAHGGDRIWWDYRDWTDALRTPAVVGSWPEPFAQVSAGTERLPVRVVCLTVRRPCSDTVERLAAEGVDASIEPRRAVAHADAEALRVLVGPWARVRSDRVAATLEHEPATSGVFARFERAASGWRLAALDESAAPVERLGAGAGLVAGLRAGDDPATWLVTGTDGAGVEAAVGLLRTDSLAHRYAIASAGGHEIPLPEGG